MACDERLPEEGPEREPQEAALQTFLEGALNLSPQPLLPGAPFGGHLDGGLIGSPLPRMDHTLFYGGVPLEHLGAAGGPFPELGEGSFGFGCFS